MITFIALIVSIIGGLNWLAISIFGFDVVAWMFGVATIGTRIVYGLVGVACIWLIGYLIKRGRQIIVTENKTVE